MVTTMTRLINRYGIIVSQMDKWICSVGRHYNSATFLFMTCHRVCNKCNTTDATNEAGFAYTSRALKSPSPHSRFCGVRVSHSFVFCLVCNIIVCLFVLFPSAIALCLRITACDYLSCLDFSKQT